MLRTTKETGAVVVQLVSALKLVLFFFASPKKKVPKKKGDPWNGFAR